MHKYLSIDPSETPTYYRMLGLKEGESNADVIDQAAEKQLMFLRSKATSAKYGDAVQRLLNKMMHAKLTLLSAEKKAAYDLSLVHPIDTNRASAPVPAPIVLDTTDRRPLKRKAASHPAVLQQYWKHIAAGATGLSLMIGGLVYAISGGASKSSSKDTDVVATKVTKDPVAVPLAASPKDELIPAAQPAFAGVEQKAPPASNSTAIGKQPADAAVASPASTPVPTKPVLPVEIAVAVAEARPPEVASQAPSVDKDKVKAFRAQLRKRLGIDDEKDEKPTAAQVDRIREYLNEPAIRNSAIEAKGCMEQMFSFALQLGDLERLHAAYLDIQASPFFPKDEVQLCAKLTKELAATKGSIDLASTLLDDQVRLGSVKPEEAAQQRAELLISAASSPEVRKDADKRAALAKTLVRAAESVAKEQMDSVLAKALLTKARSLPIAETEDRKEFVADETRVRRLVDELQEFRDAEAAIKANPTDADARTTVSDYWFARDNHLQALEALESNHPLSQLAKETTALLLNPNMITGRKAFAVGEGWMKEAEASKNSSQAGKRKIAVQMLTYAIDSTVEPLDVLSMADARKFLSTLGGETVQKPIATTGKPSVPAQEATKPEKASVRSLMGEIDLSKHVISGEWTKNSRGEIVVKSARDSHLALPWNAPVGDYEVTLEMDVQRTTGDNAVQLVLPFGKETTLVINGWPESGGWSGINSINGKKALANESGAHGIALKLGKHTVTAHLSKDDAKASVVALVDGKEIVRWSGDINTLTPGSDFKLPTETLILSTYNGEYTFSDVRISEKQGKTTQTEQSPSLDPSSEDKPSSAEPKRPKNVPPEAVWNGTTGSWYLLLNDSMTFTDAMKAALAVGAVPAIIDSKEENDFVQGLPEKQQDIWIGYVKGPDGKLYTLDGRPAPYENWNPGEGKSPGEKNVHTMWGGKHADSYPDVRKARVVLEWKAPPDAIRPKK